MRSIGAYIVEVCLDEELEDQPEVAASIREEYERGDMAAVIQDYEGFMSESLGRREWFEWSESEVLGE